MQNRPRKSYNSFALVTLTPPRNSSLKVYLYTLSIMATSTAAAPVNCPAPPLQNCLLKRPAAYLIHTSKANCQRCLLTCSYFGYLKWIHIDNSTIQECTKALGEAQFYEHTKTEQWNNAIVVCPHTFASTLCEFF